MSIFNLSERNSSFIGKVQAVDTANIVVKVENEDVYLIYRSIISSSSKHPKHVKL